MHFYLEQPIKIIGQRRSITVRSRKVFISIPVSGMKLISVSGYQIKIKS